MKKLMLMLILGTFVFFSCTNTTNTNFTKLQSQYQIDSVSKKSEQIKNIKNDLTKRKLLGKIKTITETTIFAMDYKTFKKGDTLGHKSTEHFDEKGNKIWNTNFETKGIYEYDDKGNEILLNSYKSNGDLMSKLMMKYDDKGNQVEWDLFKPNGDLMSKGKIKYDDKGNEIEYKFFKSDGSLMMSHINRYETFDKIGNWIKKINILDDGKKYIVKREIIYY